MISGIPERRLALIHRVIVPDKDYPKEYAILVTNRQSLFIRQMKSRRSFVLRNEMRIGPSLVTDVIPKTLEDYERTSLESLASEKANLIIAHETVTSLAMRAEDQKFRRRDFFLKATMNRQKEIYQVYNFEMNYRSSPDHEAVIKFYMVPLGAYFKPRRQTQSRETVLREYTMGALAIFQKVLPANIISV